MTTVSLIVFIVTVFGYLSHMALRPCCMKRRERSVLQSVVVTDSGAQGSCPICFDVKTLVRVSCTSSHRMCHECIQQWNRTCSGTATCPVCRGQLQRA